MPAYFLDASALVKRYTAEVGTQWVKSLCLLEAENIMSISQASTVEVVAAFCRKVWTTQRPINTTDRDLLISLFRQNLLRDYAILPVTQDVHTHAGDLCAIYRLRAYDSVQLASTVVLKRALAQATISLTFVTGDNSLTLAAQGEGFTTANPDNHQ